MDSEEEIQRHAQQLDDARHRINALESGNTRMATNMEAVVEKLETIIEVIRGNLKTPEVPGLMHRMAEMRASQQVQAIAIAEMKVEMQKLKEVTDSHKSKATFAMGWIGGAGWIVSGIGLLVYWLSKLFK